MRRLKSALNESFAIVESKKYSVQVKGDIIDMLDDDFPDATRKDIKKIADKWFAKGEFKNDNLSKSDVENLLKIIFDDADSAKKINEDIDTKVSNELKNQFGELDLAKKEYKSDSKSMIKEIADELGVDKKKVKDSLFAIFNG